MDCEKGYGYMTPKGPQTMVETILLWSVRLWAKNMASWSTCLSLVHNPSGPTNHGRDHPFVVCHVQGILVYTGMSIYQYIPVYTRPQNHYTSILPPILGMTETIARSATTMMTPTRPLMTGRTWMRTTTRPTTSTTTSSSSMRAAGAQMTTNPPTRLSRAEGSRR